MRKIIIEHTKGDFFITIHAAPNMFGKFQWYWMNEPNEVSGNDIKGQVYESITLSKENIKKNYMNKWLACHCEVDGECYNEGCVYLTGDFIEMIRSNLFDEVSFIGDDGNIRDDVCYISKHSTE